MAKRLHRFYFIPEEELETLFPVEYQDFKSSLKKSEMRFIDFARWYFSYGDRLRLQPEILLSLSQLKVAFIREFRVNEDFSPSIDVDRCSDKPFFRVSGGDPKEDLAVSEEIFAKWTKLREITRYREIWI